MCGLESALHQDDEEPGIHDGALTPTARWRCEPQRSNLEFRKRENAGDSKSTARCTPPKYAGYARVRQQKVPYSNSAARESRSSTKRRFTTDPSVAISLGRLLPFGWTSRPSPSWSPLFGGRQSAALLDWTFAGRSTSGKPPPGALRWSSCPKAHAGHTVDCGECHCGCTRDRGLSPQCRPTQFHSRSRGHTCRTLRGTGSVSTRLVRLAC